MFYFLVDYQYFYDIFFLMLIVFWKKKISTRLLQNKSNLLLQRMTRKIDVTNWSIWINVCLPLINHYVYWNQRKKYSFNFVNNLSVYWTNSIRLECRMNVRNLQGTVQNNFFFCLNQNKIGNEISVTDTVFHIACVCFLFEFSEDVCLHHWYWQIIQRYIEKSKQFLSIVAYTKEYNFLYLTFVISHSTHKPNRVKTTYKVRYFPYMWPFCFIFGSDWEKNSSREGTKILWFCLCVYWL